MTLKKGYNIFKKRTKKKKCVLFSKNTNNKYSCFNRNSLLKIIKQWNKTNRKKNNCKKMKVSLNYGIK